MQHSRQGWTIQHTLLLASVFLLMMILWQGVQAAAVSAAPSMTYAIDWEVFGRGMSTMSSADFHMSSTIGQPMIGVATSSDFQVGHGFWIRMQDALIESWQTFLPTIIR